MKDPVEKIDESMIQELCGRGPRDQRECDLLLAYECYSLVHSFLEKRFFEVTQEEEKKLIGLQILLILYRDLEDFEAVLTFSKTLLKEIAFSFQDMKDLVLEDVFEKNSWVEKRTYLMAMRDLLVNSEENIRLLEYLAFLLEKKLFLEEEVTKIYEEILNLNPRHIKSLRYFKNLFLHEQNYLKALEKLEQLVRYSPDHREIQRYAHEQANLLFYHFKKAEEALIVLETYCGNNKIEIRKITSDLYFILGKEEQLIPFLLEILYNIDRFSERQIYFNKLIQLLKEKKRLREGIGILLQKFQNSSQKFEDLELLYEVIKEENLTDFLPQIILMLKDFVRDQSDRDSLDDFLSRFSSS